MSLSVYVVDDHPLFRQTARYLLEAEGYEIAGEAGSGEAALNDLELTHPDVVLLDVQLPGIDGFEVARRLAALDSPPAVLLTSARPADDFGDRVGGSAARAFIRKQDLSGEALALALGSS